MANEPKDARVEIRLEQSKKRELELKASKANKTLSDYVRDTVLKK